VVIQKHHYPYRSVWRMPFRNVMLRLQSWLLTGVTHKKVAVRFQLTKQQSA